MFGCPSSACSTASRGAFVQIVEQDAHAHAAIGRGEEMLREQLAGRVAVEDVVLQVDRIFRAVGERKPREQRVDRVRQAGAGRNRRRASP